MTVEELIRELKNYNPQRTVVLGCEHDSYTGHTVSRLRATDTNHIVIEGPYVPDFISLEPVDEN